MEGIVVERRFVVRRPRKPSITFTLDRDLNDRVREEAIRRRVTLSSLIERSLLMYLDSIENKDKDGGKKDE